MSLRSILFVGVFSGYLSSTVVEKGPLDISGDDAVLVTKPVSRIHVGDVSRREPLGARSVEQSGKRYGPVPVGGKKLHAITSSASDDEEEPVVVPSKGAPSKFFRSASSEEEESDEEDESSESSDNEAAAGRPASSEDDDLESEEEESYEFRIAEPIQVYGGPTLDLSTAGPFVFTIPARVAELRVGEYLVKIFLESTSEGYEKEVGIYSDLDADSGDEGSDVGVEFVSSSSTIASRDYGYFSFKLVDNYDSAVCGEKIQGICDADDPITIMIFKDRFSHMVPFSDLINPSHAPVGRIGLELGSAHVDFFETVAKRMLDAIEIVHKNGIVINGVSMANFHIHSKDLEKLEGEDDIRITVSGFTKSEHYDESLLMKKPTEAKKAKKKDLVELGVVLEQLLASADDSRSEMMEANSRSEMMQEYKTKVGAIKPDKSDRISYKLLGKIFKDDSGEILGGFDESITNDFGTPVRAEIGSIVHLLDAHFATPLTITDMIYDEAEDVRVVGAVAGDAKFVIKFEFKLEEDRSGMDKEAAFASAVAPIRGRMLHYIAQTYFVSAPGDYILGRSLFNIDKDAPESHYIVRVGTPVRVMLMERLGKPLKEIPAVAVAQQLKSIARQGLEILRAIHEIGFVHGDVHDGNFVLSNQEDGSASAVADGEPVITIKAIDFGQSRKYDESSNEGDYPIGEKSSTFLSISELEKKFPAPKDDLFRWGETLLNIVTKGKYFSDLSREIATPGISREEIITKTLEWKRNSKTRATLDMNQELIQKFMGAALDLPYNAKPGDGAYDALVSFFD